MIIERAKHIQDFSPGRIPEVTKISCFKVKMEVFNSKLVIKASPRLEIIIDQVRIKIRIEKAIVHSSSSNSRWNYKSN